ncbi:MAG TPA: phosphosulfolactate synthase [Nitrososphaerales archaeon]|nr:phosphosulfolactate synthase [Nitrososphaerales archaeon]
MSDLYRRKLSTRITMVIDRLYGLVREEFDQISDYVDIVEIGWGLPLVWKEEALASRIRYYRKNGIRVSTSGTLLEHAIFHNSLEPTLKKVHKLGFDLVEISDGIIDLSPEDKAKISKDVKGRGFEFLVAVGKKDPSSQLSPAETVSQLEAALTLNPLKVVLEGRERGRGVGIFDDAGNIKWNDLRAITQRVDQREIIFEAPSEAQQASLILELGSEVNLGNVAFTSIATLESERQGLRFDTFGIDRPQKNVAGGPSVKFVLFVIRNYQPVNQQQLVSMTRLPLRTVQKALEQLLKNKVITEHPDFEDRRSRIYRTTGAASPISRR